MIIIVSGVSGSGKSTIGRRLAERLGARFYDADNFHSQANIDKMSRGEPLTDQDRLPWLQSMARAIKHWSELDEPAVLACSALKESYRQILSEGCNDVRWVYLKVSAELITSRLLQRQGHFMKANMLASQFAALEEPDASEAIIVDGAKSIDEILALLVSSLNQRRFRPQVDH